MSRQYYFLVAGLPDLFLDQEKKDFNILRFTEEVKDFLHPDDFKLVELLFLTYDNYNILNKLLDRKLEFSSLGKFPKELIDEIDDNINSFPSYIIDFYNLIKGKVDETDDEKDIQYESERVEKIPEVRFQEFFFNFISKNDNGFIVKWFEFLRNFQNILTAISCRSKGIDIPNQLVGEGVIVDSLCRSQSPDFGLKNEVDYIDNLIQIASLSDTIDRERRLDLMKWEMVDELTLWDYFTIEKILAFFVKANIVYRWSKLDKKIGQEMFSKLLSDVKNTYIMPKELT